LRPNLGGEVHEDRRGVEFHRLEHVAALVKVDHGEEEFVGEELGVAVGVCHEAVLVTGLLTDGALPGQGEGAIGTCGHLEADSAVNITTIE
jgi:hypothetical protein